MLIILGVLIVIGAVVVGGVLIIVSLARRAAPPGPGRSAQTTDPVAPARPGGGAGQIDPVEQIRRLAELRDQGLLSEEEFQAKRTELLGRI